MKKWAEIEMAAYDRLSPEMRAVVCEYGDLPDRNETPEAYVFRQKNEYAVFDEKRKTLNG